MLKIYLQIITVFDGWKENLILNIHIYTCFMGIIWARVEQARFVQYKWNTSEEWKD